MRLDQFTVKAQEAIAAAQTERGEERPPEVTPEHLLQRAGRPGGRRGARRPRQDGRRRPGRSCTDVDRAPGRAAARPRAPPPRSRRKLDGVLKAALREAEALKDQYVSTEHLLLALLDAQERRAGEILKRHGVTRDRVLQRAARDPRQPARRRPQRRGPLPGPRDATAATSPSWPARASSTPSSAATTRCAAWSRCSPAAPRTTRCSSASPAWARPPSWRAWPSASWPATCRSRSRTSGWWPSTWARSSPGPSTAASSRTG